MFDFNDPFYRPLWLRIAIVGFTAAWGLFEFVNGARFWAVLFLVAAAVAFHGLFIAFNPRDGEPGSDTKGTDE